MRGKMENIYSKLERRQMDLNIHRALIDEELNIASFLLYNLSGQIVGYQQYNPNGNKQIFNSKLEGKYYTYRNKTVPTVAIFGMETYDFTSDNLFIVEGMFDAARLTSKKVSCVAVLCNNPPADYRNLFSCFPKRTVVVCDNNKPGLMLAPFGDTYEVVPDEYGDLGDCPDSYVDYLVERYC
jgi:hypothetical protein